ncbi:MAG: VCBS repeat-containing protein [Planctomycetes bacterium]|nr:VCBS repeat-containing protein [Planctomycetota bacterium]
MTSKGQPLPGRFGAKNLLALSAAALLGASLAAQAPTSSGWSPPEITPSVSTHERLPLLHPHAFLWRKPGPGSGQNTRTVALALGEFDSAPGPDLISVQDDGTLMLSRNWEMNLGEPVPPTPLPVALPPFFWDPSCADCGVLVTPVRLGAGSPRQALAVLTQTPPQLFLVVDPAVSPRVVPYPVLPIVPRALQAIDLDHDGKDELFFAQSHRFEAQPLWLRFLGFAYIFDSTGQGLAEAFELGAAASPIVDLRLRDLEGDGDCDLVLAEPQRFHVWLQDASGTLVPSQSSAVQPFAIEQLALGDLDANGVLDVAVRGARDVRAYLSGSARFPAPDLAFDTHFASWISGANGLAPALTDFALTDLDGDRASDWLLSLEARACVVAWRMDRGGRLSGATNGRRFHGYMSDREYPSGSTWLRPNPKGKLVLGDLDLDGDSDAFLLQPTASQLMRLTNRKRNDAPELLSIDVPYAALRAGGPPFGAVSVTFEYRPNPSYRPGQAMMMYRLFRQTPQGFDPVPLRVWAGSALPAQPNLESFPLQRRWWSESERLALLVSTFEPPFERMASVFWISGALDRGGQQNGNGTTSCPQKHEQVVWETEYTVGCREATNTRRTRRNGPPPGTPPGAR